MREAGDGEEESKNEREEGCQEEHCEEEEEDRREEEVTRGGRRVHDKGTEESRRATKEETSQPCSLCDPSCRLRAFVVNLLYSI